jgi:hypothetical protein
MNQKLWRLGAFLFILFSHYSLRANSYEIVSKVVGQVSDYFITSREIQAQVLLASIISSDLSLKNESLKNDNLKEKLKENSILEISSKEFQGVLSQTILERVVGLEADSFSFAQISESEINEFKKSVESNLKDKTIWKNLQVEDSELISWFKIKKRAQKYIEYKTESSSMRISDDEARNYFDQNRYKFGSAGFVAFKENIRQFLLKQKIVSSLKEWFEVLRKKYKVRIFIPNAT